MPFKLDGWNGSAYAKRSLTFTTSSHTATQFGNLILVELDCHEDAFGQFAHQWRSTALQEALHRDSGITTHPCRMHQQVPPQLCHTVVICCLHASDACQQPVAKTLFLLICHTGAASRYQYKTEIPKKARPLAVRSIAAAPGFNQGPVLRMSQIVAVTVCLSNSGTHPPLTLGQRQEGSGHFCHCQVSFVPTYCSWLHNIYIPLVFSLQPTQLNDSWHSMSKIFASGNQTMFKKIKNCHLPI